MCSTDEAALAALLPKTLRYTGDSFWLRLVYSGVTADFRFSSLRGTPDDDNAETRHVCLLFAMRGDVADEPCTVRPCSPCYQAPVSVATALSSPATQSVMCHSAPSISKVILP